MHHFASEQRLDIEALRARLQKMDDAALRRFGRAARFMRSPEANFGKTPRENFVIQLNEAIAEWRRRHPKGEGIPGGSVAHPVSHDAT